MQSQQSEVLWNRNYMMVMFGNFALYFAFYVFSPILPIYLCDYFGATKDVAGLILAGYTLAALVVRPFSGFVVDSFSRKKVLVLSFFMFALFFFGYIVAGSLFLFGLLRTLHGAPFGMLTVANSTAAIDVLPSSRRNEGIGYYGLSNNLATAIAPSVGIFVYETTGDFRIIFIIAFVVALLGALAVSTIRMPQKQIVPDKSKLSLDRFFLVRAWILAVIILFFGLCYGILANYLAIYGKSVLGVTSGTGTFFLLLSAGLIVSRIQGARALRQGKIVENASQGVVISLIGYVLFVVCPNQIGYYLSAVLIGLGNGHMYPAFQNMFVAVARNCQRGTANSTILLSWDAGSGLGLVIGGMVAEHFGFTSAFAVMAFANFLGAVIFFLFGKRDFLSKRLC